MRSILEFFSTALIILLGMLLLVSIFLAWALGGWLVVAKVHTVDVV